MPETLMAFGQTVAGQSLVAPPAGRILHPRPADRLQLLRLHARACRIAETNLSRIGHKEVARALDQDMIRALIACLTSGTVGDDLAARRHQARILDRFQEVLAAHPHRLLRMRDVCNAIGVSERTFRASCATLLGVSPGRYQRLRRLKLVREELLRTNPATISIAEMMKRFGFADPHRFVADYSDAYGETPLTTPRTAVG